MEEGRKELGGKKDERRGAVVRYPSVGSVVGPLHSGPSVGHFHLAKFPNSILCLSSLSIDFAERRIRP